MSEILLMKMIEVSGSLAIFLFFMWRIHATLQKHLFVLIEQLGKLQSAHDRYTFDVMKQQNVIINTALDFLLHAQPLKRDCQPATSIEKGEQS